MPATWTFERPNLARVTAAASLLAVAGALWGAAAAHAVVPGANGKIAFTRVVDDNFDVFAMDADGTNQVNLTNSAAPDDDNAAWSPDGNRIAFTRSTFREINGETQRLDREVFVMNADGSNQVNVSNNDVPDDYPTWSPDGTKILFRSVNRLSGQPDLYVMNADGTNPVNLTNDAALEIDSAWSPDGAKIAFTRFVNGDDDVWVMNADGSNQVNVSNNQYRDGGPAWSPDSTRIAYARTVLATATDVFVVNADGTNPVGLTNTTDFDVEPAWSPDGAKIAFQRAVGTNAEIWSMNANGSGQVNLTNNPGVEDSHPDWGRVPTGPIDGDGDGVADSADNCPAVANADQADQDGDGRGDLCDTDRDGDTVANAGDNCPEAPNTDQADLDGDRRGDVCDADRDGDTVADTADNCPDVSNAGQADRDLDGLGDACDADGDGDGISDASDNCPTVNNAGQADLDADGLGDACDADRDGDGRANIADNCPDAANGDQADWDGDGIGDACDADRPPAQQLVTLSETIATLALPGGTSNSLTKKLRGALDAYNSGDIAGACAKLDSFTSEVRAQSGKKIPTADANAQLADAQRIKQSIGC